MTASPATALDPPRGTPSSSRAPSSCPALLASIDRAIGPHAGRASAGEDHHDDDAGVGLAQGPRGVLLAIADGSESSVELASALARAVLEEAIVKRTIEELLRTRSAMSGLHGPAAQLALYGDALKTVRSLNRGCVTGVHQADYKHIAARPQLCDVPLVNPGDYSARNVARWNGGDYARRLGSESAIRFTPRANRGDYAHVGDPSDGRGWAGLLSRCRMLASTTVLA
jgi:hypothetical protein